MILGKISLISPIHMANGEILRISEMVHRGGSGVEEHGNRADKLGDEDGQDGLPVVEANTDQTRAQGPVTKRQGEVEDDIVVPCHLD